MSDTIAKTDGSAHSNLWAVGIVGALLAIGAFVLAGTRESMGVAAGATLATLNFWALGLLVRRLLAEGSSPVPWALIAVAKLGILFGGFYLLVFSGFADTLPIVVGYGSLPVGIVVAQMGAKRSADEHG